MKATEVQVGDVFAPNTGPKGALGFLGYRVEGVEVQGEEVHITARYPDGGTGVRVFEKDQEVPLTRPESTGEGDE